MRRARFPAARIAAVAIASGVLAPGAALAAGPEATPTAPPRTRISVSVEPGSGETEFVVQEGSVEVSAGGTTAIAKPGEAVRTGRDAIPRVIAAKLSAPIPIEPADGQTLRGADGRLRWSRVEGAQHFTVTVARDPLFQDRVATLETEGTSATLGPALAEGLYHWRVVPRAANGVEGPESVTRSFRLDNAPVAVAVAVAVPRTTAHAAPAAVVDEAAASGAGLFWLREHRCEPGDTHCGAWLAVDAVSGSEREIQKVDLQTLKLSASEEKDTRAKLGKGQLTVRATFHSDRSGSKVLVVSDVVGER